MPLRQMPPDSEYLSEEGKIDELVVAGKKEDIKWDIRTNFNLTKSNKNAVQKCIQNKYKIFITNNNKTKDTLTIQFHGKMVFNKKYKYKPEILRVQTLNSATPKL